MIDRIATVVREASRSGRLVDVPGLDGFSGDRLIGCLQRLATLNEVAGTCYVEVGVFRGLTLVSVGRAAAGVAVYGIDNFSQFDRRGENKGVVLGHAAAHRLANLHLIDADFEAALTDLPEHIGGSRVGTYFVDGPHDYRSQLMCLEMMKPHLAPGAVIVVDDSNYLHVRQANRDFLVLNPDYRLIFEAYTPCHPHNMSEALLREARAGWWNGVNVIVHDPEGRLERSLPPVDESRRILFNDHLVHSSAAAATSSRAVEIVAQFSRGRIDKAAVAIAKYAHERRSVPDALRGRYVNVNTFSERLPRSKFNARLPRDPAA
jgi:hypothetical protein